VLIEAKIIVSVRSVHSWSPHQIQVSKIFIFSLVGSIELNHPTLKALRKFRSSEKFDSLEKVKNPKNDIIETPRIDKNIHDRKFLFLADRYFSLNDLRVVSIMDSSLIFFILYFLNDTFIVN
jgi:hypothetical protein